MSKREPLLSDKLIEHSVSTLPDNGHIRRIAKDCFEDARSLYEHARAKDRELIQTLVDALDRTRDAYDLYASCRCDGSGCPVCRVMDRADNALFAANQHGFKPSEP